MVIMAEQLHHLRFRSTAKSTLLLFIGASFLCSLFPSGNALAEIQQQNPLHHLLLPSQTYHLIFIVVEKTKRQESIPSNDNFLLEESSGYRNYVHFPALMNFAAVTFPLSISKLLYILTTSSCL
jgi:hypothetical protein